MDYPWIEGLPEPRVKYEAKISGKNPDSEENQGIEERWHFSQHLQRAHIALFFLCDHSFLLMLAIFLIYYKIKLRVNLKFNSLWFLKN